MALKVKKISKGTGDFKRKSLRKKRTLRKKGIKRKILKLGGDPLNVLSINSHLSNNEKNETKDKSGLWSGVFTNILSLKNKSQQMSIKSPNKKFLKYKNSNGSNYYLYLKDGYDCHNKEYTPKTINVLWVRHCESCANVALDLSNVVGKNLNPWQIVMQKMYREPLCTLKDKENMLKLGRKLSNIDPQNIKFFSSFLPRAMETAKIISIGFSDQKDEEVPKGGNGPVVEEDKMIKRIKYVSEETKGYDRFKTTDSSQSTTTAEKSSVHATFLNRNLKGYDIDIDRGDTEDLYGDKASNMGEYYNKFLKNYILDEDTLLLPTVQDKPIKLNVIVSHGGYIRMNISEPQQILRSEEEPSKIEHPRNIECFLVKYSVDRYGQITCEESENEEFFIRVTGDFDTNILKNLAGTEKRLSSNPCELSYGKDIKSEPYQTTEKKTSTNN